MSRRFSSKLTINADYTWAKAIDLDDVDNDQNAFPEYTNLKPFYAPAGFDRRNVFNIQYVYNLPKFQRLEQTGAAHRRRLGVVWRHAVLGWNSLP